MSKHYKYILGTYILICMGIVGYALLPINYWEKNSNQIYLSDYSKDLLKQDSAKYSKFTNFELNFITDNNLSGEFLQGRNIFYRYASWNNFLTLDGNRLYMVEMTGNSIINFYYFKNSKYILAKIDIPYSEFFSADYYLNFSDFEQYNAYWNFSYTFLNKDYQLNQIYTRKNNELIKICHELNKQYNFIKPKITISLFIETNPLDTNQSLMLNVYKKNTSKDKKSMTLGLNIIYEDGYESAEIEKVNYYIENGGN